MGKTLIFRTLTRTVQGGNGGVSASCPKPRMAEKILYSFPPPPEPSASEWPGTPIGITNTITRTKGRTAVHNKTVDATPGLLEKLLQSVQDPLESGPREKILH